MDNEVIVGSADVKALYPSLDVDFTVDKVCEVFYGSEVRVEGVNVEELGARCSHFRDSRLGAELVVNVGMDGMLFGGKTLKRKVHN